MIAIEATTADTAWRRAARQLQNQTDIQQGRDQPTRELLHVMFAITDPRQRIVFARPFNPALAVAEVIWMLSGGNASGFLIPWNPRIRQFVDDDVDARVLHGAYGDRLGSRPQLSEEADQALRVFSTSEPTPIDQVRMAYEALTCAPDSRQVVLQIWDPGRD